MKEALARAGAFVARQSRRSWAAIRRHPWRTAALVPVVGIAATAVYVAMLVPLTPSIMDLRKAKTEAPAMVLSADGKELAVFKRANREWVGLADISPHVLSALIATEDRRFFQHHGIDIRRTCGALVSTLGGELQGGSTLTQQLARNLYPEDIGRAPTITRKLKEAITALKIESVYTKKEILETYLNTVPFLYNAWGIEMAARTYFDKSARELDVLQSATLIGMLKGTRYYNPVLNPERAQQRRNIVLAQMVRDGKLETGKLEGLKRQPLKVDFERQGEPLGPAPHITQQLRRWLIDWADRNGYNMYADGLVIHTTIDSRLQAAANDAVAAQGQRLQKLADAGVKKGQDKPDIQAGFMAMDPASGYIKAWVGSRDFTQDQFDHVQQARRQPGSTFKPFVYGAAFEQGISPAETLIDGPVEIRIDRNQVWRPTDVGPPSGRALQLREGLAYSKNTITAQLIQRVGPQRVAALARSMGVRQSKLDEVMSLALGTSPVTLHEMVAAYGTIANGGNYVEPILVSRIANSRGEVLQQFHAKAAEPALSNAAAVQLVDALRGVIDKGTGTRIRHQFNIQADVAGKTGTTQDNTDGWFILMHPQLVAGAWVGFNDNRHTMGSTWGQGAQSALPIVGEFFQQALKQKVVDAGAQFARPPEDPKPLPTEPALLAPVYDWFNSLWNNPQRPPSEAVAMPAEPLASPPPLAPPMNFPQAGLLQAPPSSQPSSQPPSYSIAQPAPAVPVLSVPAVGPLERVPAPSQAAAPTPSPGDRMSRLERVERAERVDRDRMDRLEPVQRSEPVRAEPSVMGAAPAAAEAPPWTQPATDAAQPR